VAEKETVLPLLEEVARVEKNAVETGRLRIAVRTETVEDVVRDTLRGRHAEVERVAIGREVATAPAIREEADRLIVPVLEEILVVEKRLVLREEIHLRFTETATPVEQRVERRVQQASLERLPPDTAAAPGPGVAMHPPTPEEKP
jgi:stress response protein YsnF